MYAIFKSGGKQYEATTGAVVKLEKLPGEVGQSVTLSEVLMVTEGDQVRIGQPVLEGVAIQGRIVMQGRGRKIVIYKYKRRKDYSKKMGHRQDYTAVRIESIGAQSHQETAASTAQENPSEA
jgi:large subunit ribosomal protein L21